MTFSEAEGTTVICTLSSAISHGFRARACAFMPDTDIGIGIGIDDTVQPNAQPNAQAQPQLNAQPNRTHEYEFESRMVTLTIHSSLESRCSGLSTGHHDAPCREAGCRD